MSLDVYLTLAGIKVSVDEPKIYIRENGSNREITREEWDQRFPDREPYTLTPFDDSERVYEANITHNLGTMAEAAGIYKELWRPEEINVTKAKELIEPLEMGLHKLKAFPEVYKALNPSNGWGNYDGLVQFVENYLIACREWPEAEVSVWR